MVVSTKIYLIKNLYCRSLIEIGGVYAHCTTNFHKTQGGRWGKTGRRTKQDIAVSDRKICFSPTNRIYVTGYYIFNLRKKNNELDVI